MAHNFIYEPLDDEMTDYFEACYDNGDVPMTCYQELYTDWLAEYKDDCQVSL